LRGSKDTTTKKENTDLVGRYLTRPSRESADETIATYLGMTQEEKERELRRILVSMDLILEVAEKRRCWRAAAMYLKMVDYDGSFLPMTSAVRDRWEKTYARHVDKWEQLEKRRAEKAAKAAKTTASPPPASGERPAAVSLAQPPNNAEAQPCATEACPDSTVVSAEVEVVVLPNASDERSEALAAQRRAHQDKLNAAIPGRACRGKKRRKPGALTPGLSSATHTQKGQVKGKATGQKPVVSPSPTKSSPRSETLKTIDSQVDSRNTRKTDTQKPP
jgi:hypothetical protein